MVADFKSNFFVSIICGLICSCIIHLADPNITYSQATPNNPFAQDLSDPNDLNLPNNIDNSLDPDSETNLSSNELLDQAVMLLSEERLLDARTKLLKALKKDPENEKAHLLLGGYYLVHVGHFRLALKYIKQAEQIFLKKHGLPPYQSFEDQSEHARILYMMSEARLNLDNYQGALDILDQYSSYSYYANWYPASRAWILMKLGRLAEAIKEAQIGVLTGAETGRTLNILGILLSMNGQREQSLQVFQEAILYEFALGNAGQPATPLNNSGEVYRETFDDEAATKSWLKATSLPDGCEHILPTMNLNLLFNDQLKFEKSKQALENFKTCTKQFPLKNDEEHKGLEHLALGRIAMHTGQVAKALEHFQAALDRQQWFGKIGTSSEDLKAAAQISLAQGLKRYNNLISFKRDLSWSQYLQNIKLKAFNSIRAWWLMRRARQLLSEELNDIEDIYPRNTDSMIEYSTFGELLAGFPSHLLEKRIDKELESDRRPPALAYYKAYLAENYLNNFNKKKAHELIKEAQNLSRSDYDQSLQVHLSLLLLQDLSENSRQYNQLVEQICQISPYAISQIRNSGKRLPIVFSGQPQIAKELAKSAFIISTDNSLPFQVSGEKIDGSYRLSFVYASASNRQVRVEDPNLKKAIDKFTDKVFSFDL